MGLGQRVGVPKLARVMFVLLFSAATLALFQCARTSVDEDLATGRDLHGSEFVTSRRCVHCHEDHGASWGRTFHRTMTQEATETAVLAPFDGTVVEYLGWRATMRRDAGEFVMNVRGPEGQEVRYVVERTVGSHRYQQYLAREEDRWIRLPWAFHVGESRWFHMNGAFLTPDPSTATASTEDHERHMARWNDNCVFCHNVGPNPGLSDEGFSTEVAELGIACEACHGPGEEHARLNASPLRRYTLHGGDTPDPTIINPARLDPERSADVCGRCHGQRLAPDIGPFLRDGDPFVPGDDLARYSEPLWTDTTLNGSAVFEPRFWRDGTPRLTAYEYQGWLQSRCEGDFTCTTCHGMHEGDPAGQLRPSSDASHSASDSPCIGCHATEPEHGGLAHSETECVDCHMPRIVYGVLDVHRSHRIDVPRPTPEFLSGRPDACGLCHLDQPADFFGVVPADAEPPSDHTVPVGLQWLLGGDPIERAVAADAYGRSPVVRASEADAALCSSLVHDDYPAVRRLAWRALRRRHRTLPIDAFDPMGNTERRTAQVARLDVCARRVDALLVERLRSLAASTNIEIGE